MERLNLVHCIGTSFALAAAVLLWPAPVAHACGGFFCSRANPVNQSAEEIIFVQNTDDTVTAVIRINYQGPSTKFAWVLPIDGVPTKVDVSSNAAFDSLRNATNPSYSLMTTVDGTCSNNNNISGGGPVAFPGGTASGAGGTTGGVGVLAQGSVGPYDWEVIKVDPQLADAADAAVTWLTAHGYDVTDLGPSVLRPYLADGLNLMAFKLTKGADAMTGSIRPVMLTYNSKLPTIPIRPTAVAAQPDLGIVVYVLSDKQAIPQNYKSLVLNEALIDWRNGGQNYLQVVTAAADEAGGQGFVSELAGDSGKLLAQAVYPSYIQQQWMSYSLQTFASGYDAIQQATQFGGYDGWREAVCGAVTQLPAGVTCDMFGRSPQTYMNQVVIDQTMFLRGLYEGVIKPISMTQDLVLSRPYVTRLFTTMSPEEMTLDPLFDFNPDLADISNVHTATQVIQCSSNVTYYEAPWTITLPQGDVIHGKGMGTPWPFTVGQDLPSNLKVVVLGTSGSGKVVEDNSAKIAGVVSAKAGGGSGGSAGSGSGTGSAGSMGQKPADQRVPIGGAAGSMAQKPADQRVPIGGNTDAGTSETVTKESKSADAGAAGTNGGSSSVGKGGCAVSAGPIDRASLASVLLCWALVLLWLRRRATFTA